MSIVGVALGIAVLIATMAILTGFSGTIQTKIAGTNAHLLVNKLGAFDDWPSTMERLEKVPGVTGVAPLIEGQVMISSEFTSAGALFRGIDPEREIGVTELEEYMTRTKMGRGTPGSLDHPESVKADAPSDGSQPAYQPGIILGSGLAAKLLAFPGDRVTVISAEGGYASPTGVAPTSQRFKVVGLFESGMYQIDQGIAYIRLADAQALYDMEGFVSSLQLKVEDLTRVEQIQPLVEDRLSPEGGDSLFRVASIKDKYRNLFVALKLEKVVTMILLSFIVMVAAFNILTSLTMIVMEKTREIAILKAMGATGKSIQRIFMLQGLLIGSIGTLLGNALGLGFSWALSHYQFVQLPKEVYYITRIPVDIRVSDVAIINLVGMIICLLATIWPSRNAAGKDPVEALRHE